MAAARRLTSFDIAIDADAVTVSDQGPLKERTIRYDSPGWDFPRFVAALNARVFFWPGGPRGLVASGRRHLAGLLGKGHSIVVLRVPAAELFALNGVERVAVTRCNSGAPRGRAVRGAGTFTPLTQSALKPVEVVEVTVEGGANLPAAVEVSADAGAAWTRILVGPAVGAT